MGHGLQGSSKFLKYHRTTNLEVLVLRTQTKVLNDVATLLTNEESERAVGSQTRNDDD